MSAVTDDFIKEARSVGIDTVFGLVKGKIGKKRRGRNGDEYVGACPACGGTDRFSINFQAGVWHCRQCDGGRGGDGFDLYAVVHGFNLKSRAGLLAVCGEILQRPVPEEGERESEEERLARVARIEDRQRKSAERRDRADKEANSFAQKAIDQGRGMFFHAVDAGGSAVEIYLKRRTGVAAIPESVWENLKLSPRHTYWHGKDDFGREAELHCGPAMIAPFVNLDRQVTGCHQTWIDLSAEPKLRPLLFALDAKGEREKLITKKMRGHKKGSVIPILGAMDAARWVAGEGIETTLAWAGMEGWRDDTFYCAAGDINNLTGPADAGSSFFHPTIKKPDVKGVWRPVTIAGPVPKPDSAAEALHLPPHVTHFLQLADGDSEPVMTASAMARGAARHARPGLELETAWPPQGMDWAEVAVLAAGQGRIAA